MSVTEGQRKANRHRAELSKEEGIPWDKVKAYFLLSCPSPVTDWKEVIAAKKSLPISKGRSTWSWDYLERREREAGWSRARLLESERASFKFSFSLVKLCGPGKVTEPLWGLGVLS